MRCVSRCHCYTPGPLQRNDNLPGFILRGEQTPRLSLSPPRREYYRVDIARFFSDFALPVAAKPSTPSFARATSPRPRAATSTVIVAVALEPLRGGVSFLGQLPGKWLPLSSASSVLVTTRNHRVGSRVFLGGVKSPTP